MYADLVFEGGGVKGIGFAGAICSLEERGYQFKRVAGTSAGAIIASLIAVGYTCEEIKDIIFNLDYTRFLDRDSLQSIPLIGPIGGFLLKKAIYSGDYLENFLRNLFIKKGKTKFKDVKLEGKWRLKIIATDITNKEMLILPDDIINYGINPDDLDIALAVRMSTAIPFYFKPVILKKENKQCFIVDGGVVSNFPVWIFDVEGTPRWPTFGLKFLECNLSNTAKGKSDIIHYAIDIIDTMVEENELRHIRESDFIRTITIPTNGIRTTEFNITREKSMKLFTSGYKSVEEFIEHWDFENYKNRYREKG